MLGTVLISAVEGWGTGDLSIPFACSFAVTRQHSLPQQTPHLR